MPDIRIACLEKSRKHESWGFTVIINNLEEDELKNRLEKNLRDRVIVYEGILNKIGTELSGTGKNYMKVFMEEVFKRPLERRPLKGCILSESVIIAMGHLKNDDEAAALRNDPRTILPGELRRGLEVRAPKGIGYK